MIRLKPFTPPSAPTTAKDQRHALETASWVAVVHAYEECGRRYASMLECFDLTVSQFDALSVVQELGDGAMPKCIAQRLRVTRPSVSGLLHRLEERRLVEIVPHSSDGRALVCRLTAEGKERMNAAQAAAERFLRAQTAPFPNRDLAEIEALMRNMHRHLQTLSPESIADGDQPGLANNA